MTEKEQDTLIERLVDKLGELSNAHNALVMTNHAMLAQINQLALKVQALEAKDGQVQSV